MSARPPVVAFVNQKGGVGKTTTTLGIASAAVAAGRRPLVLDLDRQANATTTLEASGELTIYDVLYAGQQGTLDQAIVDTAWPGVRAVPGSNALTRFEVETMMMGEVRLRTAMDGCDLSDYDVVLIDCPPALGRCTLNALIAATHAVIVAEPAPFAVAAVGEILQTLGQVREYNASLRTAGVIVNKVNAAAGEHQARLSELTSALGEQVWEPTLPRRTSVEIAQGAHLPIHSMRDEGGRVLAMLYDLLWTKLELSTANELTV